MTRVRYERERPPESPAPILALQRTAGNAATARAVARMRQLARTPAQDTDSEFGSDSVKQLMAQLASIGLPTAGIAEVAAKLDWKKSSEGDRPQWTGSWIGAGSLEMSPETFNRAAKLKLDDGVTVGPGVDTIYHELTHALLDLHKKDPGLKAILEAARQTYAAAPMEDGSRADDPNRVLQEAAAEYVGGRVAAWVSAMQVLSSKAARRQLTAEVIAAESARYDRAMAARKTGYEDRRDGWLSRKEVHTAQAIPEALRIYLDLNLLDGRIKDHFADDPRLSAFTPSSPSR